MRNRVLVSVCSISIAFALLTPVTAAGQAQTATAVTPTGPRTGWGDPDLQGLWSNSTITPFERPDELTGQQYLTQEEAAALERLARETNTDGARSADPARDVRAAYNDFWWERGTTVVPSRRTSLMLDPPDGKLPPLTPEARRRAESPEATRVAAARSGSAPANSWEDLDLNDRCILGPTAGPPMVPAAYNNNFLIVQTPRYVAILAEYMHQVRIIPLEQDRRLEPRVRQWMGDSRGRWEGETLVVETKNFTDKTDGNLPGRYSGSGKEQHLVEHFTRSDADTIDYEFTVQDATKYTKPWTAAIPLKRNQGPIFEYACHEGNYGLVGILSGSRAQNAQKRTSSRGVRGK